MREEKLQVTLKAGSKTAQLASVSVRTVIEGISAFRSMGKKRKYG